MPWGEFFTWVCQILIVLFLLLVLTAAYAGVRESFKNKDK